MIRRVIQIVLMGFGLSALMYIMWNPDTTDTHGFFLFWGWAYAVLLTLAYELGRSHAG